MVWSEMVWMVLHTVTAMYPALVNLVKIGFRESLGWKMIRTRRAVFPNEYPHCELNRRCRNVGDHRTWFVDFFTFDP